MFLEELVGNIIVLEEDIEYLHTNMVEFVVAAAVHKGCGAPRPVDRVSSSAPAALPTS